MMKTLITLGASTLLIAMAHSEPVVVGFERFHQKEPSAAGGRLLYNELGCANCHGRETGLPARRGPAIAGITQRIQVDWLKEFLLNPAKTKNGTNMPHLISSAGDAEAVVHYLASLKPQTAFKPKNSKYLNAERGNDVFHTMGCAACHEPSKDFQPPAGAPAPADFTHRSVPLPDMAKKYSVGSLASFLTDPLKLRPDGRMPHIELHDSDSADLAAYLMKFEHSDGTTAANIPAFKFNKELAAKGKAIVSALNCAACHDLPKEVVPRKVAISNATAGCLGAKPDSKAADYGLNEAQRSSLALFLQQKDTNSSPKELATLTLQALNCTACHARDGLGGPDAARRAFFTGDHNLGDTGLFPPPLADAGRKLKPKWLADLLTGKNRVRPYLQTKMPKFGKSTDQLAELLQKADAKEEVALPSGDVAAGQKLMGTAGGMGCITCHRWDKRPSLGIQALDLSTVAERLEPGWLHDYLINPAAQRAGTLMPSFWPGGVSANPVILGGDTKRQIASIIAFAASRSGEPEGYPSTMAGEFELMPKDQPIIQRTFLEGVGTHAILVGFPAGIHFAYDGLHAQPAVIWKGKFFDAYNTWFTRAAPFEKPLGQEVARWAAASEAADSVKFRGYKLDAKRVPTFLYDVGDVRVEERLEPVDGTLHRVLTWDTKQLSDLPVSHPQGVTVSEAPGSVAGHRNFIYSWK